MKILDLKNTVKEIVKKAKDLKDQYDLTPDRCSKFLN